jgi:hypothetical protein
MSKFTDKLRYVPLDNGLYKVTDAVRFYLSDKCEGDYVELKKGALTNFASVPKSLQIICRPDADDVKMPAAFHDSLVCEFGQQIYIKNDGEVKNRKRPTWSESAFWFRKMIKVRQRQTRRKFSPVKKLFFIVVDFFFRWACWLAVMLHGLMR